MPPSAVQLSYGWRDGPAPMTNEVVVAWFTNKPIGAGQIGQRPEPRIFDSPAAAVMFVIEELEKSARHNVRMIVEGVEFSFVEIVRMYAARRRLERRNL